jgi:hypothetical protein
MSGRSFERKPGGRALQWGWLIIELLRLAAEQLRG